MRLIPSSLALILTTILEQDEAGFESLVGSEETLLPSRIYSEKALCMSKGFIAYALVHELGAVSPITNWLYLDPTGPKLLKTVVEESNALLRRERSNSVLSTAASSVAESDRLSAGAEVLLKRHLTVLEDLSKVSVKECDAMDVD